MFPGGLHPGKNVLKARVTVEFAEDRTVFRDVRVMPETFPKRGLQPVDRQICLIDEGIAFADPERPELDVSRTRQKIRIEAGFGIFRLSFQCQAQKAAGLSSDGGDFSEGGRRTWMASCGRRSLMNDIATGHRIMGNSGTARRKRKPFA